MKTIRILAAIALFASCNFVHARDTVSIQTGNVTRSWFGDIRQLFTFGADGSIEFVGTERPAEVAAPIVADAEKLAASGTWSVLMHTAAGTQTLGGHCVGAIDFVFGRGYYVVLVCDVDPSAARKTR